ncbi:PfkB family carbohydrate kinase [Streptomyces sp. NPDC001056]
MVTFFPTGPERSAGVRSLDRATGGAESDAACAPAAFGHAAGRVSGVGADGWEHLVEGVEGYGVDMSAVHRDPARPTGVYVRTAADRAARAPEAAHYRAVSAVSFADTDLAAVAAGRVPHLGGITAALSGECLALTREPTAPRPGRPLVSFDADHRPAPRRQRPDGPRVLLEPARRADIVFVATDEAREARGLRGGRSVLAALPEPATVVIEQGRDGATACDKVTRVMEDGDGTATFVRAPTVDVVAHVVAGAAFAAPTDLAPPPTRAPAALNDAARGRPRPAPGWTQPAWAPEEANTP